MTLLVFAALLFFGAPQVLRAADPPPSKVFIDPLEYRWTFGNHEPLSMYRRIGQRSTGGVDGSALWLADWHHWFDSEGNAKLMNELGFNILHSRFYKGMGWQFESRDFPAVKQFVDHCHRHGIKVLAYVQFSTLYYETMLAEIPDLEDWAAVDESGKKQFYGASSYFRWLPCINHPAFEAYLKKMIGIALTEGGFDGIMIDNCFAASCHCQRCVRLFREHLARESDPEGRFGIPTVAHVVPPPQSRGFGEIQDQVAQEWIDFRTQRTTELYRRLYRHVKSVKPTAIVSGNVPAIRRANHAGVWGLNVIDLSNAFDLYVSQSGNAPGVVDGRAVNRVREMKLAQALNMPVLALSDGDAGAASKQVGVLTLVEDAVFGGIPNDRPVLKPDREMALKERVASHRPLLQRFNRAVGLAREPLRAPSYSPVQVLYSRESIQHSEQAYNAVLGAEEILLRNHVPYGLLPTAAAAPLTIPESCEVLLVCDQRCLSQGQIDALVKYARGGGRLIVTGQSGGYDERYRQRRDNPLWQGIRGCPRVVQRSEADAVRVKAAAWTIHVDAPREGGRLLMADLAKVWSPPILVQTAPTVFAEVKRTDAAYYVHLVNYAESPVDRGARIELSAPGAGVEACTFMTPMDQSAATPVAAKSLGNGRLVFEVPRFADYGVVTIRRPTR